MRNLYKLSLVLIVLFANTSLFSQKPSIIDVSNFTPSISYGKLDTEYEMSTGLSNYLDLFDITVPRSIDDANYVYPTGVNLGYFVRHFGELQMLKTSKESKALWYLYFEFTQDDGTTEKLCLAIVLCESNTDETKYAAIAALYLGEEEQNTNFILEFFKNIKKYYN